MAYENFGKDELILRDKLALDRTVLANERTYLSYVRTALIFLASGITFMKFFPGEVWTRYVGLGGVLFSLSILVLGTSRFLHFGRKLAAVEKAGGDGKGG